MNAKEILSQLTFEEKASLLTGGGGMCTYAVERFGIESMRLADGPHGVRAKKEDNCTSFPALCAVGATWNKELVYKMGEAIANDCIEHNVDTILGPGINIKRTPRCGRNFEYVSEDPVLSGEIAAAYINGVQSKGVGTCLKHYALNNQEKFRLETSVEVDMRVMHEIYLKGFEIAVKKSNPYSIMSAFNKVHSIWCGENKYLLNDVLRNQWGYAGCVMSDWNAVRDICKSVVAGLNIQMPRNGNIINELKAGVEKGDITIEDIDKAVETVLGFVMRPRPVNDCEYDRDIQHKIAHDVASESIVLLKNDNKVLPLTKEKYKKIAVIGEYAENPLIFGQGSAEVYADSHYVDIPLNELKKHFGNDVEIKFLPIYSRCSFPEKMIWPDVDDWENFVKDCDAVVCFAGAMESEDTEQFDRRTIEINPNIEYVISSVARVNSNVIVVLQSGSALALGEWKDSTPAIIQMWLGGEAAGSAIADVLVGKVNPSGRLSETFPKAIRTDMDYPGDGLKVVYNEGFDVGYRYYDKRTDEVVYPFGYGLSYTTFDYSDYTLNQSGENIEIGFTVKNTGDVAGADVAQIYVGKEHSCVTRSIKDLKAFEKIALAPGESKRIKVSLPIKDLAYYNVMLNSFVVEPGEYTFMLAKSASDVIWKENINIDIKAPYTINSFAKAIVG